jgi:hypothetical protein
MGAARPIVSAVLSIRWQFRRQDPRLGTDRQVGLPLIDLTDVLVRLHATALQFPLEYEAFEPQVLDLKVLLKIFILLFIISNLGE